MTPFDGFADVQCGDADCKQKPKAETMSGLKVVDDTTFTIKTSDKVSNLLTRLGYSAFAPQPQAFFDNPETFGRSPSAPARSRSTARARPRPSSASGPTTRAWRPRRSTR